MAAGVAQKLYAEDPSLGPVVICNKDGKPRWSDLWEGNTAIYCPAVSPHSSLRRIYFGKGCLPYYKPNHKAGTSGFDRAWRAQDHRARVYLTEQERDLGRAVVREHGPFLLIEPTGLDRKNKNRYWPHWQDLADLLKTLPFAVVQLTRPACDRIGSVRGIPHGSFRQALGILSVATLSILPEGGLAMGAAAIGAPAVVLWGGCSDAVIGSYPEHVNLIDDDPQTPCGSLFPCEHCTRAWAKLTPERVFKVSYTFMEAHRLLEAACPS